MPGRKKKLLRFGFVGFVVGGSFPVAATIYGLWSAGKTLSLAAILDLHLGQPLFWMIDTVPVVLAIFSILIGIQSLRVEETTGWLAEHFSIQTANIHNELQFFQALIRNAPFAVVQLDNSHRILAVNPAFETLFGFSEKEIIGRRLDKLISPNILYREAANISRVVTSGNIVRKVSKRKKKDGSLFDVEIVGVPVFVGGENIGALGLYHDISAQIEAEKALLESRKRFRSLFNDSPISLWEEDFSAVKALLEDLGSAEIIEQLKTNDALIEECINRVKILNVNQATLDLFRARSKDELLSGLPKVLTDQSLDPFRNELIALIRGETFFETEIHQRRLDGGIIYGLLRMSLVPGYEDTWGKVVISILDITERKQTEEKLRFMSFHDSLTGLYNRAYFEEEMARLGESRKYPVSLILCDLDGLKQINDTGGHQAGDRAILGAAKILGSVFRNADLVARIGGDEFAIILPHTEAKELLSIEARLRQAISAYNREKEADGLYRPLSLSSGFVTVHPGESLKDGYKIADERMYFDKDNKKHDSSF